MKSLKSSTDKGCPFDNKIFTQEVLDHIFSEDFTWEYDNNSYTGRDREKKVSTYGCYKKYEDGNGTDIYIYICEDGIEIDNDYDCGGNLSTHFIEFDEVCVEGYEAFEATYDKMVDYVNRLKS